METQKKGKWTWAENANVAIMSVALVSLFAIGFVINNDTKIIAIHYCGWTLWVCSCVLAFSPNFIFKKYGGVPAGKAYTNTTKLVDRGIYAIIRHPQYAGGLYVSLSLILIQQTLASVIIGAISMVTCYLSMIFEDRHLIDKFGEEYKNYMQRVPRADLISGTFRMLRRKDEAREKSQTESKLTS